MTKQWKTLIFLSIFSTCCCLIQTADSAHLPKNLKPKLYQVYVEPHFQNGTFRGKVNIQIDVQNDTNKIFLHARNLTITRNQLSIKGGLPLKMTGLEYYPQNETMAIILEEVLKSPSEIYLEIDYNGLIHNDDSGFYNSSYFDDEGNLNILGTTQLEPTSARRVFPCFDEPLFKAEFEMSIFTPTGYNAISNMPVEYVSESPQGNLYKFQKTLKMSPHILAFVVSKFFYLEYGKYRVYAQPRLVDQGRYSLKIVKKLLELQENYWNQNYSLPKLDVVGIPDFSNGAMENWGLITFREQYVLYHPNETSDFMKEQLTRVVAHEVAHQWFGNLVTPEWWTDTWLSESFASYMQFVAVDELRPSWRTRDQMFVDICRWILEADGLEDTIPISKNVTKDSEISQSFSSMTYSKGPSVLRMIELTVGPKIFQSALRRYLQNRKFNTAVADDLWKAFQSEFDKEGLALKAKESFEPWITQTGYPVLTVKRNRDSITVTQNRFFYRNLNYSADNSTTWPVPISWISLKNPDKKSEIYWLKNRTADIKLESSEDDVVIVNRNSAGHYRINYDLETWKKIIDILNSDDFEQIPEINRAAIIDDILNLARSGLLDYSLAFEALEYLKRETSYFPIKAATGALNYLVKKFDTHEGNHIFHKYLQSLIAKIYDKISFFEKPEDDHLAILLRGTVTDFACRVFLKDCIDKSISLLVDWKDKNIPIPKNLRLSHIYNSALRNISAPYWEFTWNEYKKSQVMNDKDSLLKALGQTKDRKLLDKFLLTALSTTQHDIRPTDVTNLIKYIYSTSSESAEYIMDFVEKNPNVLNNLHTNIQENSFTATDVFIKAAKSFPKNSTITKLQNFGKKFVNQSEDKDGSGKVFNKALEIVKFEVHWSNKNLEYITACVKKIFG